MPLFLRVFWLLTCGSPAKWTSSSSWSFRRGSACGRAGRRCAPWARSRLSSRRPCGRARRRGRRRRHPPPSRSARRSSRPSTVWWAGSARRGRRARWRARRTRVACPAATGPGRCLQHAKRVQLTHSLVVAFNNSRTCILQCVSRALVRRSVCSQARETICRSFGSLYWRCNGLLLNFKKNLFVRKAS